MPLITAPAWMAGKLAEYGLAQTEKHAGGAAGSGEAEARLPESRPINLVQLISAICSRILVADPGLVADVALGRVPKQALTDLIGRTAEKESLKAGLFQKDLLQQVMDFLFGYGPLQPYIEDEEITDIDGTGFADFTVKINGRRQPIDLAFPDARAFDTFCRLAIVRNGGIINENDSHCRVSDERYRLRINVAVPPRSVNGPVICIRKHRQKALDLAALVSLRMLDEALAVFLTNLARTNATVIFCGKGAAGKTTLLRAFIQAMPPMERVLIAESDTEIYPDKACCMVQRTKKAHEGGRQVTLRDLIGDGLTMSLDTYCIGEIVSDEALEFIRAAFSGHRCLATIHADCADDALDRLLLLAQPAATGEGERILRRMLGRSVDYVVHLQDFRVCQVLRVIGYREAENHYEMVEVWPEGRRAAAGSAVGEPPVPLVPGQGGAAVRV
jgi:pilus assembly protein CpaF